MKQKIISQSHSVDWQIDFIMNIEVSVLVYSPLSTTYSWFIFFFLIDDWWSHIQVFVWSECNLELRTERGLTYFPINESSAFHFFFVSQEWFFSFQRCTLSTAQINTQVPFHQCSFALNLDFMFCFMIFFLLLCLFLNFASKHSFFFPTSLPNPFPLALCPIFLQCKL